MKIKGSNLLLFLHFAELVFGNGHSLEIIEFHLEFHDRQQYWRTTRFGSRSKRLTLNILPEVQKINTKMKFPKAHISDESNLFATPYVSISLLRELLYIR